jgi:protein-tyrosine phosphatase
VSENRNPPVHPRVVLAGVLQPVDARFGTYRGLIRLLLAYAELWCGRLRDFTRVDLRPVKRVVFVCQGNICRSCYAEHLGHSLGLPCASTGLSTTTGAAAFPTAVATARRFGVDLVAHRVIDIRDFSFLAGDLLLAMEVRQARALRARIKTPGVQVSLLGLWAKPLRPHIHDPFELSDAYFHRCFAIITQAVRNLSSALGASC